MTRRSVVSREYKVMLRAERFEGPEAATRRAVGEFWADVARVVGELDIPTAASTAAGTSSANASTSRATTGR